MQIRNLRWKGFAMWPPEWMISDQGRGEEGVLEEVYLRTDLKPKLISVVANHLGDIRQRDYGFWKTPLTTIEVVFGKLKQHIGRPLTEIGDLEITFLPLMESAPGKCAPPPRPAASRWSNNRV